MSTTIIGRLTADPNIKFTTKGTAVLNFSVAVNYKEEVSYFDCTAWGTLATGIMDTLKKGDRVLVDGFLSQQRWETDGQKFSKVVLTAQNCGPDLRFATAVIHPTNNVNKNTPPEEEF
jgi:single-strand DNA-binding protein